MLAVMGTSTCHVMNGDDARRGAGHVRRRRGGIVPGLWGYEAGQSGVGDIFGWFVDNAGAAALPRRRRARAASTCTTTSRSSPAEQEVGEHGLVALDWHNGNRSVLVDHELSGLIVGLTLATRAEDIYRALIEATAFGTRTIVETFEAAGVPVHELIVAGGLLKNPVLMQIYADVTAHAAAPDRLRAGAGARLGDARGGRRRRLPGHPRGGGGDGQRRAATPTCPTSARADAYDALYAHYTTLHDHFGRGGDDVMHALRALRPRELARG